MVVLTNVISDVMALIQAVKEGSVEVFWVLVLLWVVQFFNMLSGNLLCVLGIIPRRIIGLTGIIASPFLHSGFNHLFFNSVPLFLLLTFLLSFGIATAVCVTLTVMIMGGGAVWLFGRNAIHVGASGIIMGYMGYMLINAYHNPNVNSVILGVVSFYYLGTILFSLVPSDVNESWEGHFFGFLAGVFAAYFGCVEPFITLTGYIMQM